MNFIKLSLLLNCIIFSLYSTAQKAGNESTFPYLKDTIPYLFPSGPFSRDIEFEKAWDAYRREKYSQADDYYKLSITFYKSNAWFNRALCHFKLKDKSQTCENFKISAYLGNKRALNNYKCYCDSSSGIYTSIDSVFFYNSITEKALLEELPDSYPQFPGGLDSLYSFILTNLHPSTMEIIPELRLDRVLVKFTIDESGRINNPSLLLKGLPGKEEFNLLFSKMPNWKPAIKDGKAIKMNALFPVINLTAYNVVRNKFYNKGVELLNEGKIKESISCFNTAISINEKDFDSYYNRGIALYKMNERFKSCLDWGEAYILNDNQQTQTLINKFCDSTFLYHGKGINTSNYKEQKQLWMENSENISTEMPQFPGGWYSLIEFIINNVQYPQLARTGNITGKVYVNFTVDRFGMIKDPVVIKGIGSGCDEEAIRLIKSMPPWTPGKINNLVTSLPVQLPIYFYRN